MIEIFAQPFGDAYYKLISLISEAHRLDKENHVKAIQERVLANQRLQFLASEFFNPILRQLNQFGFNVLVQKGNRLYEQIMNDINTWTADRLLYSMREFRRDVDYELKNHRFVLLDSPNDKYFSLAEPFGAEVHRAFPSARSDFVAAGNCLACGLHTACVFHLMRGVEFGLRALSRDRRIIVPKKPLVLAAWEDIIRELEKAEQEIQGYPATLAREAQFEFYHGAMMEFKRFKNKFRNRVSHAREDYDSKEAEGAYEHVKLFMEILATRISERKRTQKIWKRA